MQAQRSYYDRLCSVKKNDIISRVLFSTNELYVIFFQILHIKSSRKRIILPFISFRVFFSAKYRDFFWTEHLNQESTRVFSNFSIAMPMMNMLLHSRATNFHLPLA